MSTNKLTIHQRLFKFQSELKLIDKNSENSYHKNKYAALDHIQQSIQPLLISHGLFYTQAMSESGLQMVTTIYTEDGESLAGFYPINLQDYKKPQEIGSAVTYARRYALCAILGLIIGNEDDDGNSSSGLDKKKDNLKTKTEFATSELISELKKRVNIYNLAKGKTAEDSGALLDFWAKKNQVESVYDLTANQAKHYINFVGKEIDKLPVDQVAPFLTLDQTFPDFPLDGQ